MAEKRTGRQVQVQGRQKKELDNQGSQESGTRGRNRQRLDKVRDI